MSLPDMRGIVGADKIQETTINCDACEKPFPQSELIYRYIDGSGKASWRMCVPCHTNGALWAARSAHAAMRVPFKPERKPNYVSVSDVARICWNSRRLLKAALR